MKPLPQLLLIAVTLCILSLIHATWTMAPRDSGAVITVGVLVQGPVTLMTIICLCHAVN
jgi:hypothetical protein